jgi:hypothetical protein
MSPLYYARVASFVNETAKLKSHEVEQLIEAQAELFEKEKSYLVQVWKREAKESTDKTFMQKLLRGLRG